MRFKSTTGKDSFSLTSSQIALGLGAAVALRFADIRSEGRKSSTKTTRSNQMRRNIGLFGLSENSATPLYEVLNI